MCREVACSEQGTERSRGRETRWRGVWSSFTAEGCFFECKMQNAKCKIKERSCEALCFRFVIGTIEESLPSFNTFICYYHRIFFRQSERFPQFCILHFAFCISERRSPCIKPYTANGAPRTLTRSAARSISRLF